MALRRAVALPDTTGKQCRSPGTLDAKQRTQAEVARAALWREHRRGKPPRPQSPSFPHLSERKPGDGRVRGEREHTRCDPPHRAHFHERGGMDNG